MSGRIRRAEQNPRLKFPLIGKIKCGMKNDRGFPMSVDYFIPTGTYSKYFTDAYGSKPSTIQVVFMNDDPSLVCNERLELRDSAGAKVADGDGINFMVYDEKTELYKPYSVEDYPELIEKLATKHGTEWKSRLTLRFLVPKIAGLAGHWELTTGGVNSSIPEIIAVFDKVLEERGFIRGIIFDLNISIHKSNKPKSKKRFPVISLVPNHSKENLEMIKSHVIGVTNEDLQRKNIE